MENIVALKTKVQVKQATSLVACTWPTQNPKTPKPQNPCLSDGNLKIFILFERNKMGGCCTTRMKVDEHSQSNDFHVVNTLPSFDNVFHEYNQLHLPAYSFFQIPHKKEQMIFMIVNMIR